MVGPSRLAWQLSALAGAVVAACTVTGNIGSEANGGGGSGLATSGTGVSTTPTSSAVPPFDKIDLLLSVESSAWMTDKQQLLSEAMVDLLGALTNPTCLDASGQPSAVQPASPLDACPDGATRQLPPILDMHVGVVTGSIGSHGGDACVHPDMTSCPGGTLNPSTNDHGYLITRVDPCSSAVVPTYQGRGFLAWDPSQTDVPPGLATPTDLTSTAGTLVTGAGQIGCRYQSQMESWYRLLVDSEPYQSIDAPAGEIVRTGIDAMVLTERQDFLRPDSLLVILMLDQSNDCSIQEVGQGYLAAEIGDAGAPVHLAPPRSECAVSPSDPCCRSCAADQTGCPPDPACAVPTLDDQTDGDNLRCWDEKRRFGVDFLYDTSRYVAALTNKTVTRLDGKMVDNPIFSVAGNAGPDAGPVRDASLVLLAGIVGVPWQDVAVDPTDLTRGFLTAAELRAGVTTPWDVILGDPTTGTLPADPHMLESTSPRSGVDPSTGTALAPPGSPAGTDPISGHEYTQSPPDDLEYACIFTLPKPRSCTGVPGCDCADAGNDNPLCDPDPGQNNQPTLQARAKAYPSLRQLRVLHDLGDAAVVTSICPAQTSDATRADYGYKPAVRAVVSWVAQRAAAP